MKIKKICFLSVVFLGLLCFCKQKSIDPPTDNNSNGNTPPTITYSVDMYTTAEATSSQFSVSGRGYDTTATIGSTKLYLDISTLYQEIDGFGAALTGSSAYLLNKMSTTNRDKLLKELFDTTDGMGWNFLRVSIG